MTTTNEQETTAYERGFKDGIHQAIIDAEYLIKELQKDSDEYEERIAGITLLIMRLKIQLI